MESAKFLGERKYKDLSKDDQTTYRKLKTKENNAVHISDFIKYKPSTSYLEPEGEKQLFKIFLLHLCFFYCISNNFVFYSVFFWRTIIMPVKNITEMVRVSIRQR